MLRATRFAKDADLEIGRGAPGASATDSHFFVEPGAVYGSLLSGEPRDENMWVLGGPMPELRRVRVAPLRPVADGTALLVADQARP